MMFLARFVVRLAIRLGLRWVVLGALTRWITRRFGKRVVAEAANDLEEQARQNLPAPVSEVVRALPDGVKQAGGSAVVAGRAAKRAARVTRQASQVAASGTNRARRTVDLAKSFVDDARSETEASSRRLRSQYLAASGHPDRATEALLDVRSPTASRFGSDRHLDGAFDDLLDLDDDPHLDVPEPIRGGRRRARLRRPRAVDRLQRSYRPASRPWD